MHEQNPHTPFHSPSESVNVETQETSAPLLNFISARVSRTPLRTPMTPIVIPFAHLSDASGTNIERLAIVPSQGLFGRPSIANITPALNEGTLVARTVVR